jgi:hypothetical protein
MTGSPGGGYAGGSASHGGHAGSHARIGWSSGGSDGRARVGSAGDPPPLRGDASQRCDGTYLHTTHHSSIIRICYRHHPFFGQTVEIVRWLRRLTTESLIVKLSDGLELAIPAWMLDPVACSLMCDAPAPRLTIEVLLALCDLLDRQPLLHTASPATPCVSPPEGARDAQESSASPSVAGRRVLHHPHHLAPAAPRQAPAVSRAPRPTAHRDQPQGPKRGV